MRIVHAAGHKRDHVQDLRRLTGVSFETAVIDIDRTVGENNLGLIKVPVHAQERLEIFSRIEGVAAVGIDQVRGKHFPLWA